MAGQTLHQIAEKTEVHNSIADMLTAQAGVLNPIQLDALKEILKDEAILLKDNTVITIPQSRMEWDYAGFSSRISHPVDEHDALADTLYSKLNFIRISWDAKEFTGAIPISDKMSRDVVGQSIGEFVMRVAAPQLALDIEETGIQSVYNASWKTTPDNDLLRMDGLIQQATSHVIDPVSVQPVNEALFYGMQLAMPVKYWRDLANMRYYVNPIVKAAVAYGRQALTAERGYRFIENNMLDTLSANGIPIVAVPGIPSNTAILTHRNNIVWAIVELFKWELEREAKKARWLYHVRYQMDVKFAVEDAVVIHKNIEAPVAPTI